MQEISTSKGSLNELTRRIQAKIEADRAEIETLTSSELRKLVASLQRRLREELNTIEVDMEQQVLLFENYFSRMIKQTEQSASRAALNQQKWSTRPLWIMLSLLTVFFVGSWGVTQYISMKIITQMEEMKHSQEQLEIVERTIQRLQDQSWGIELREEVNGRWVILPAGWAGEDGWGFGDRKAIKLVRK